MCREDIERITIEYGEGWGYNHVQRVLRLINVIGEGLEYDKDIVWYAAYLHDWGAFPNFYQKGMDHAFRSKTLAADILKDADLPDYKVGIILEAVENHDFRNEKSVNAIESILLREADFLDFLGAIGIVRKFAQGPNDLRKCLNGVLDRRDKIKDRFSIAKAREIAEIRICEMNKFIESIEQESFGFL